LLALVIIWIITLVGLIILVLMLKEERQLKTRFYKNEIASIFNQKESSSKIDDSINIGIEKRDFQDFVVDQVNYYDE